MVYASASRWHTSSSRTYHTYSTSRPVQQVSYTTRVVGGGFPTSSFTSSFPPILTNRRGSHDSTLLTAPGFTTSIPAPSFATMPTTLIPPRFHTSGAFSVDPETRSTTTTTTTIITRKGEPEKLALSANLLARCESPSTAEIDRYRVEKVEDAIDFFELFDHVLALCLVRDKASTTACVQAAIAQELKVTGLSESLAHQRWNAVETITKPSDRAETYMNWWGDNYDGATKALWDEANDLVTSGLIHRDESLHVVCKNEEQLVEFCRKKVIGEYKSLMEEIYRTTGPVEINNYINTRFQKVVENHKRQQKLMMTMMQADPLVVASELQEIGDQRQHDEFIKAGCVSFIGNSITLNGDVARDFANETLVRDTFANAIDMLESITAEEIDTLLHTKLDEINKASPEVFAQLRARGMPLEEEHWSIGASGCPDWFQHCCWMAFNTLMYEAFATRRLIRRKIALSKVRKMDQLTQDMVDSYINHHHDRLKALSAANKPELLEDKFFQACCTRDPASGAVRLDHQKANAFARRELVRSNPWIV